MTIAEDVIRAKRDLDDAFAAGKKAENDAFWDDYQQNGNRTDYSCAFGGIGWNDVSFKPKYNINIANDDLMFGNKCAISDLGKSLRDAGVTMTIKSNAMGRMFQDFRGIKIGGMNYDYPLRSMSYMFYRSTNLEEIEDTIPLRDDGSCTCDQAFRLCYALKEIRFSGVIGQDGFDFKDCTQLSRASIESILNALSTTTKDLKITFSKEAVDVAFAEAGYIGSESQTWDEWTTTLPIDGEFRGNWIFDLK